MKKLFGTVSLLVVMVSVASSQERRGQSPEMGQRMKAEKVSFLSSWLNLTPEEAQAFWPVYNEFDRKKSELEAKRMDLEYRSNEKMESLSEAELKKMNEGYIAAFAEESHLMQEYNKQFLKVLPLKKVMKLYESERKFRLHMLQEFRRREQDKSGQSDYRRGDDKP